MLVVGWLGFGGMHPSHLTPSEQYTHISLWALLSAPLIIGCDLTRLDDFTMNLLTNDEVIAIDQDPLGKQGTAVLKDPSHQVIVKELEDGSKAVGLFNLTENNMKIYVPWAALKISGKHAVRDVWRQRDLGVFTDNFESIVPPHGVVLVKI
jgi:alpha-galactosidase